MSVLLKAQIKKTALVMEFHSLNTACSELEEAFLVFLLCGLLGNRTLVWLLVILVRYSVPERFFHRLDPSDTLKSINTEDQSDERSNVGFPKWSLCWVVSVMQGEPSVFDGDSWAVLGKVSQHCSAVGFACRS